MVGGGIGAHRHHTVSLAQTLQPTFRPLKCHIKN
jgi:hypothetical protein